MKYWKATLKNGNSIDENSHNWGDIKHEVKKLDFNNNGQIISMPEKMDEYMQAKTASASLAGNDVKIESRYIGFKKGKTIVRIRINEKTNNINVEID